MATGVLREVLDSDDNREQDDLSSDDSCNNALVMNFVKKTKIQNVKVLTTLCNTCTILKEGVL